MVTLYLNSLPEAIIQFGACCDADKRPGHSVDLLNLMEGLTKSKGNKSNAYQGNKGEKYSRPFEEGLCLMKVTPFEEISLVEIHGDFLRSTCSTSDYAVEEGEVVIVNSSITSLVVY